MVWPMLSYLQRSLLLDVVEVTTRHRYSPPLPPPAMRFNRLLPWLERLGVWWFGRVMQQPYALRILGDNQHVELRILGALQCLQVNEEYDGGKPDHDALCNTRIMFGVDLHTSFTDLNIHRGSAADPFCIAASDTTGKI